MDARGRMTTSERDAVRKLAEKLEQEYAKAPCSEENVDTFDRVLRESHLPELLAALSEWDREEYAPVKDVLLVNQRRKELRAAKAAFLKGAEK